jgi:PAS domain S-box-containing protein
VLTEEELAEVRPALLADAPIPIVLVDRNRRVRYINRVEHGYQRSAVQDISLDELLPAQDRERIAAVIDGVLRTGVPASYETRSVAPSGPVLYLVRVNPLRVRGEIRYAVLFALDITEEYQRRLITDREHALLTALERVNRVMLSGPAGEPIFDRVLGEMLALFQCDRALLAYPCDPHAAEIRIVFEQTTPEFSRPKGSRKITTATADRLTLACTSAGAWCASIPSAIRFAPAIV